MTDKPILFSAPMVRALLEGRKTQTRRVLKPQPETFPIGSDGRQCDVYLTHVEGDRLPRISLGNGRSGVITRQEVKAAVGDRLWVREAWAPLSALTHSDPGCRALAEGGFYRADDGTIDGEITRWRPSIHMPRWASRITLTVTDVRVERLQSISEADAIAEGCAPDDEGLNPNYYGPARDLYGHLWDRINGPGAWASDPWVAAYTFAVHRCNIDQMEVTP
jgi:hypothetical protein